MRRTFSAGNLNLLNPVVAPQANFQIAFGKSKKVMIFSSPFYLLICLILF